MTLTLIRLNDLGDEQEQSQARKKMMTQREQLKMLLRAPMQRHYFGKYPTKSGKLQKLTGMGYLDIKAF
jgi:hypothetical protein